MPIVLITKAVEVGVDACPFCRSEGTTYAIINESAQSQIMCSNCKARGSVGDDQDSAVTLWNRHARYQEVAVANARAEAIQETTQQLNAEIKGVLSGGSIEAPSGL